MDPSGILALAFFVGLAFVCFEAVQFARGRVHLREISRAALELLIVAPVVALIIVICETISNHFGFGDLEAKLFTKWATCVVLLLVWAPWSHYRMQRHSREK
jgi:hypothetical protein